MSFVVSERYDRLLLKPDDLYYRMICVDDLYRVLHDWFDFAITVSNKEIAEMLRDAFWNGSISRDERCEADRADIIAIDDGTEIVPATSPSWNRWSTRTRTTWKTPRVVPK